MEDHVFAMLEVCYQNSPIAHHILRDVYIKLHYTEENFKNAFSILIARSLIQDTKNSSPTESGGYAFEITEGGKKIYENEKKKIDANTLLRQVMFEKEETESMVLNRQIELMAYQIRNEKWQEILNPLLQQANTSTIATNENIRKTNSTLKIIFFVTALIALLGLMASLYNTFTDNKTSYLQRKLIFQDSIIQVQQIEINQLKDYNK